MLPGFHTATIDHQPVDKTVHEVDWDLAQIEKGGFDHFMLKPVDPAALGQLLTGLRPGPA